MAHELDHPYVAICRGGGGNHFTNAVIDDAAFVVIANGLVPIFSFLWKGSSPDVYR